jgi:hypothetical protein
MMATGYHLAMNQYEYSLPMIKDFFIYLETNNYSPMTIYNYKSELAMFDDFLRVKFLRFNLLNKKALFDFKVYLCADERRTPSTHVAEFKDLVALIELPSQIETNVEARLRNRAILDREVLWIGSLNILSQGYSK